MVVEMIFITQGHRGIIIIRAQGYNIGIGIIETNPRTLEGCVPPELPNGFDKRTKIWDRGPHGEDCFVGGEECSVSLRPSFELR